ncbi:MAG: DUF1700 domain-containing protein [Actinobacteria bacterium]|nr:DUF1700 domain-containing protein [Actinomycetota bacterium]
MNEKQFIEILEKNLKGIPKAEIKDILDDFREYFDIGTERGRTRDEILASLGSPKILAKQIKAESYIKRAEESTSAANITRALFMTIGLSFFNIIFILPAFIVIISILGALFAVSVSISAAGIAGTVTSFFYPFFDQYLTFTINPAVLIFGFIGAGALGILFFIGTFYLSKLIYSFIVKYLKFNVSIIKDRRQQDEI